MIRESGDSNVQVLSPHINAPVWPWSLAGYSMATLWLLLLLLAWLGAHG